MRQPVPFGKYLLLDRISVGGMAEVFKAKSYGVEGFEKIIAIKRILPTMGEDRDFIKMFIDEAKIAGQLAHANICQIFELGRIDGSHFIAMEYIWGKDLLQIQNRLRKIKQPMPIAMACFSIAKVLEGLDYAHRKRDPLGRPLEIVHRDCSPQNVLVSYEGEVKVIDFGIAKATSRNSRTMAGVLKGKFGYMSPEQVRGLPLDRRSDIFALGTMLYECLTSERLFQGETDFSTLEKVRNVDVRPPREINPLIPPAVEAVIMKALAKDVEERYQWCSEMLADLQAFLMSQDVVFTAKSLSSWLKEVFSAEIDRERQQLEQYKRVGRDGLIAGVPAAEAKLDVVETLGEAGPVEGDPTVLGGPSFDDIEQAAGAAPEVGPAPGSPATRAASVGDDDDGSEEFGEEAPTEIFGEINHGNAAAAQPRPPSGLPSLHRPPPPPRAPTSRGDVPGMAAGAGPGSGRTPPPPAGPSESGFPPAGAGYAPPPGYPVQGPQMLGAPGGSQPIAVGTPGVMPVGGPPINGAPANQGQGRTLIGATAPSGMPSFASAPYPGHQGGPGQPGMMMQPGQMPPGMAHGQMPPGMGHGQMPPGMAHGQMPPGMGHGQMPPGMAHGQMPPGMAYGQMPMGPPGQMAPNMMGQGQPPMHGMHPSPMQGYPAYPPMPHHPYGATNQYNPGAPVEPPLHEGKKRSSIARDVAIGVAIAALVLGGFLVVKFLILDSDTPETAPPTSTLATLRLSLAAGDAANLYVDDRMVGTFRDGQEFMASPGAHKVKLVGQNGGVCFEQSLTLVAGKPVALQCAAAVAPGAGSAAPSAAPPTAPLAPTAGSGSGSAATVIPGGAAGSGSAAGSAAPAAGSAAAGSAAAPSGPAPIEAAKPVDHTVDKTDRMPAEDKPVHHATERPHATTGDKPHTPERPAKPTAADDDPLGKLQGGVKPGDRKKSR